ncbi:single-stranded-DNA-specific exonuclease RecJ [Mycoplasma sp. P36-A1]|uniref:single-stranded-DNA-specific exonuclease RecJ n=1 Tax=Mycoplasma sp. P36-A1 TaxID=3252900 RepID=UPI003C2E837D
MKYRILDTSMSDIIEQNTCLPKLASIVLASKNKTLIKDYLNYKYKKPEFEMMDDAVEIIRVHMNNKNKIMIMGDYDCDGILATTILAKTFDLLDYENYKFYIPNRIKDGYGINPKIVDSFIKEDVDLIITVDNGINATSAIEHCIENNIAIIITDHHTLDSSYINNVTYIHPSLSNLDYEISGGMVAYFLASALLNREDDYLQALASITTISDVMPLIKGNRKFVRMGLASINKYNYLPIKLLSNNFVDSSAIGSNIAPKINALGRLPELYDPNLLVHYFKSNKKEVQKNFANEIENVNKKRKEISNEFYNKHKDSKINNNFLFIEDKEMHEGLIGLIASRFSNEFNCVCLVSTTNNSEHKASLRSIEGINVYDIVKKNEKLFKKYGGHSQAMGMSFEENEVENIQNMFVDNLSTLDVKEKIYDVINVDLKLLNVENIKNLRYLEPFGNGFDMPLFILKDAIVTKVTKLSKGVHHKVSLLFKDYSADVMFFFSQNIDLKINDNINLIVKVGINNFRNNESVSMIVESYEYLT